jgi:hypothetical protein
MLSCKEAVTAISDLPSLLAAGHYNSRQKELQINYVYATERQAVGGDHNKE